MSKVTKDKEGNPVRFIRKGGRVIPIKMKPGEGGKAPMGKGQGKRPQTGKARLGKGYHDRQKRIIAKGVKHYRDSRAETKEGRGMAYTGMAGMLGGGGLTFASIGSKGASALKRTKIGLAAAAGGSVLGMVGIGRYEKHQKSRFRKKIMRDKGLKKDIQRNVAARRFVANQNKKYDPKGQKRK